MESSDVRQVNALAAKWWMLVIRGGAAIVFGILSLLMPGSSLLALVFVWGVYTLVDGVLALMLAARRGRTGRTWGWLFIEGLVGISAGVLTLAWPGLTALALLIVIAVWAVFTGVAEIAAAIKLRRQIDGEYLLAASGALSMAFGIVLLLFPSVGALALIWTVGGYAIAFGLLLIALGLRLHRWQRRNERRLPTGGAPTAA